MKKRILTMAVLCSLAGVGLAPALASAEETEEGQEETVYEFDQVIVEAQRDTLPGGFIGWHDRIGILGDADSIDVPFTQARYTEKTIEMFSNPNQPLNGVLANNPSIRLGTTSPMYTDFSMRGVNMNASHYYLNGIPNLFNQSRSLPTQALDSVEVVSGPNTVLNGSTNSNNGIGDGTAPAGLLNATTKKATTDPVTSYAQSFSGRSTLAEHVDVGRRFGKNDEWGLRVNAHYEDGGLSMKGADIEDQNIYINLDHQGEKSTTNLFAGYYDFKVDGGQRWLSAKNVTKGNLADAPDNANDLSFNGQTKYNHGYVLTLNHEQKLSDQWTGFFNTGTGRYKETKIDPSGGSLTLNDNGILSGKVRNYRSDSTNTYFQVGARNETTIGNIKNNLSIAIDRSYTKSNSTTINGIAINGDIWDGVYTTGSFPEAPSLSTKKPSRETITSVTLADRAEFGKMSAYVAAQFRNGEIESSASSFSKDSVNPTFALAYKPVEDLSFYVSHAQSYTVPKVVGAGYDNTGEIMKPIKNKQNEIGVKYKTGNIMNTLAFFDLNQAKYIEEDTDHGTEVYTQDGENRFKGVEWTITGKVHDKWNLMGGAMYLDGKREKTDKSENKDGWRSTGTPRWNGVIAAEYEANQRNTIIGRLNYVGSAMVNDNGVTAPSYLTFDLGAKYKTKLDNGTPVTLSAMIYNVMGKDYWISRGTSVCLGEPRTFVMSARFDL